MLKSKAEITFELPFQAKNVSSRVEGPTWKRSKLRKRLVCTHSTSLYLLTHQVWQQKDERFWEEFRVTCKKPRGCERRGLGQPDSSNRVILLFNCIFSIFQLFR